MQSDLQGCSVSAQRHCSAPTGGATTLLVIIFLHFLVLREAHVTRVTFEDTRLAAVVYYQQVTTNMKSGGDFYKFAGKGRQTSGQYHGPFAAGAGMVCWLLPLGYDCPVTGQVYLAYSKAVVGPLYDTC